MSQERCNNGAEAGEPPRWAGSTNSGGRIRNLNPRKVPAWAAVPLCGGGTETWWRMGNEETTTRDTRSHVERTEPIPEMRPGREVGWIFRDGDAHAIERQGSRTTPARDE
jgi:hypothetical protein